MSAVAIFNSRYLQIVFIAVFCLLNAAAEAQITSLPFTEIELDQETIHLFAAFRDIHS
ncbi:hypothetical protein [Dyadobacter sp. CY343]|uniref:hypothetical protein n=1 Tax=Dyadobacter sp. CY343 TaxID=2907299 RepID=UPI001F4309F3|nr:hypothetical protein [Dyadobacter sp. CY343]MCE7059471.1 hypothetical protein [Dyadobacter sp. CY343]